MAEKKGTNWVKWGLIIGAVIIIILAIIAAIFVFAVPSFFATDEKGEAVAPAIPEVVMRVSVIIGVIIVGIVFLAAVAFVIWELIFKKKELHIVKEHHKIIKEAAQLNPVRMLGNLTLTGSGKIQNYPIGKIVGHTQIPINFERYVFIDANGKVDEAMSESEEDFEQRRDAAMASGKANYDFFAFVTKRGFYALPFISLLEPPKIFACYPAERASDLVGDVEIYDVGTWKLSGVNIFIPGQRHQEPKATIKEMEGQLFPIAQLNLLDYLGLVAQRGIEGDTSMQKWLQAKASTVNVKENA